jgi:hypothetical protein
MSDKEKRYGQGDKPEEERPIKQPSVKVEPEPGNRSQPGHRKAAKKVKEGFKKLVDDALRENEDGGHRKQLDAAKEAVEKEAQRVPKGPVKKIRVDIDGYVEKPDGSVKPIHEEIEVDPNG